MGIDELINDVRQYNKPQEKHTEDVYRTWDKDKDWNLRRKYARSLSRVNYGVWSCPDTFNLKIVTLTSSPAKNTLKDLKDDFKKWVRTLREQEHLDFEYFAVAECTPRLGLFHFHAIFKSAGWFNTDKFRNLWYYIHRASEIDIKQIGNTEVDLLKVNRYIAKHLTKRYSDERFKCRPLISRGWLPKGWREQIRSLNKLGIANAVSWEVIEQYKRQYCQDHKTQIKN